MKSVPPAIAGGLLSLPDIANLSTALGVERSLIENDFAFVAFVQRLNFIVAFDQRDNLRIINSRCFVAFELRSGRGDQRDLRRPDLFWLCLQLFRDARLLKLAPAKRDRRTSIELHLRRLVKPRSSKPTRIKISRRSERVVQSSEFAL